MVRTTGEASYITVLGIVIYILPIGSTQSTCCYYKLELVSILSRRYLDINIVKIK